jgi:hypothetical protein
VSLTKYPVHPSVSTDVLDFIPSRVLKALVTASENLTRLGIRHAICGGVAVGAYGFVRATKDVDFLTGDEAFVISSGGITMLAPGVGFAVNDIPTDMVGMTRKGHRDGDMRFLEVEIDNPFDLDDMPLISPEGLIAMKLIAFRRKDQLDIIEVLRAGASTIDKCTRYLTTANRPDLVVRLETLKDEP